MATDTPVNWKECLGHVKFWRAEVKRSMGEPINQIEIVEDTNGALKLYALAKTSDEGNAQQSVVHAVVPQPKPDEVYSESAQPPQLLLRSLFSADNGGESANGPTAGSGAKMSTEQCLLYERMRCQTVNGISQYAISGDTFLLSSPAYLYTYTTSTKRFAPIGSYVTGGGMNAAFSPVDSNFIAFAHTGQLHVDKHNESVFSTPAEPGRTCGVASFVAQEEFERYDGFWWSPTRVEVLYERVDESEVDELSFAVPGAVMSADMALRYPLAGRANSTSTLSICHINVQHDDGVLDVACQANLRRVVPWYEYLVRCGWTADGENVWVYVMDRAQTQSALLLLPRIVFCTEVVENAEEFVKILYEEKSSTWINFNNHTQFLPNEPDCMLRAIIGSEKRNLCHLYLHIFNITFGETARLEEIDEDAAVQDFNSQLPCHPGEVVTALEARTTDALPSLADVAPVPPPVHIITSDQVVELAANPPPLPPSMTLPTPVSTAGGERRPSLTVRRLSQQVGVLSDQRDLPITSADDGEWAIFKDAPIVVDNRRQHVYYVCSRAAPTIVSLAVSSYGIPSRESRVLTPEDLSYKYERCQSSLSVNPDHGFACWLSNARTLPECRFYRLVHKCASQLAAVDLADSPQFFSLPAELPTAVFAYRIGVEMMCSNPLASIMPPPRGSEQAAIRPIGALQNDQSALTAADREHAAQRSVNGRASLYCSPSTLFHSRVFFYQSHHSDRTHYALLFWPADAVMATLGGRAAGSKSGTGRFPVLHVVYAGPHVQLVRDNWQSVANYLKFISVGFAVLFVDGRGSANRGVDFEAPIKNAFGSVELQDQVEGLETVAALAGGNLLDLSNVVVTGWSYGGYISVLLLAHYPDVYRAACAGGAVSDWTLYDTAYTERYAGDPHEYEAQYRVSSLQAHIAKLPDEDNRLLLVHGLLDENVHFRHTEKLINGIIAAGKPHQLLLLPNERHTVRSGDAIEYFHTRMLTFFLNAMSK